MQFKITSLRMKLLYLGEPRNIYLDHPHPLIPFTAAPVILPEHGQESIAHGEFGFGNISSHEIGIFCRERFAEQTLFREEKTRTTIKEQPRGVGERNALGLALVIA